MYALAYSDYGALVLTDFRGVPERLPADRIVRRAPRSGVAWSMRSARRVEEFGDLADGFPTGLDVAGEGGQGLVPGLGHDQVGGDVLVAEVRGGAVAWVFGLAMRALDRNAPAPARSVGSSPRSTAMFSAVIPPGRPALPRPMRRVPHRCGISWTGATREAGPAP